MNLELFKNELRADIRRLTAALAALEGDDVALEPTMEPHIATQAATVSTTMPINSVTHRKLSPETRKKISKSMKANWNRGRRKGRTLSPSVKAKIAESQKQRWAKQKAAAQTVASAPQATSVAA
jgi:NUMOD3 motif